MPKYMEIYHEVRRRIVVGIYAPDKKLPEGARLAAEFECSELTITKALDLLVREGLVLRKRLTITGSTLRPRSVAFKGAIARSLRENVWPLLTAGKVRPVIHSTFAAADAAQAHALMESNQHIGKIVLTW